MIFLDTNVVSETLRKSPDPRVLTWLVRYDAELALPTVTIAEMAFGIAKILPGQRAARLEQGLADWRHRFADRIFGLRGGPGLWRDHGRGIPPGVGHVRT